MKLKEKIKLTETTKYEIMYYVAMKLFVRKLTRKEFKL